MRPVVAGILSELLERHAAEGRVDLDDLAEVIGGRAVTYEEIEILVDQLEARGLVVGEPPSEDEVRAMREVLDAARALKSELGRAPSIEEIAARSGKSERVVRRSIERGRRTRRG